MKLKDVRTLPAPRVWSGHTDSALLREVDHYFPTPGPLLKEVIDRFRSAVEHMGDSPQESDGEIQTGECPACGTVLKVDQA